MRIVQLSDIHLSPTNRDTTADFDRIAAWLRADPPDCVVVSGDLAEFDPDSEAERHYAFERMSELPAPVFVIPGNHDVGENGWTPWKAPILDALRLAAFEATWGQSRFVFDIDGWRLIGANLMTPDVLTEIKWLGQQLDGVDRAAVFLHKPVYLVAAETHDEPGWSAEPGWRWPLLDTLSTPVVRVVCSGHLHSHRVHQLTPYAQAVWAPSTSFHGNERGHGAILEPGLVEHFTAGDQWRAVYRTLNDLAS
jgi:alkaline phosphatase D